MKKIISVLSFLVLAVSLCACGEKKPSVTPVTRGISFTAEVTYYNESCEAEVTVAKDGRTDMELISPDTIKGLTFHFEEGEVTAEYLGLEYKTDFKALPEGACCIRLYEILKDTFDEEISVAAEGENYCILRNIGDGGYKLYLGGSGLPISAEEPQGRFSASFKNVKIEN